MLPRREDPIAESRGASADALDWSQIRASLARRFGTMSDAGDRPDVDDLVQEACLRLHRAARRAPVRDAESLASTIARRVWNDYLRRKIRARRYFAEDSEAEESVPFLDPMMGDLRERIELIVQEIFDAHGAVTCKRLAAAFFDARDWQAVSARSDSSHAAVRKRWSRCVALARRALAADPDFAAYFTDTGR